MSLGQQLAQRLEQPGIDGASVVAADGGDRLTARIDESGPLAVSAWELRLDTKRLAGASMERVRQAAEEVTRRVTYLLEPITPVEVDAEACVVQLRSTQPQEESGPGQAGAARSYYEVLVKTGGSIALQRYESQRGQLRRSVAMMLTKEIVCRLAEDFLASVD
ncbi:MAG: hypothetical protein AAF790_00615 [Planctomycetota bacterium]